MGKIRKRLLVLIVAVVMLMGTMPLSPAYADGVPPNLTSAELNIVTGYLTLTGTDFVAIAGASNDIDATKITISDGAGGHITTLTAATSNVEIGSATSAILTVAGADRAEIAGWAIQNGTRLGENAYNIEVTAGWNGVSSLDEATQTLTVSGNPTPALTSATLDVSNGQLILTGTDFVAIDGASNDIKAAMITISDGTAGHRTTLTTATSDVEIVSTTSATLTVAGEDLTAIAGWATQNGTHLGANAYNIAALPGWNGVNSGIEVIQPLTVSGNIIAPVAKIGSHEYTSLQTAMNEVAGGGTIELLRNITLGSDARVWINNGDTRSFTLDLKGFTLSSSSSDILWHGGRGTLTIRDSAGGGMIRCEISNGIVFNVSDGGSLNIESGTVEAIGGSSSQAVVLNNGSRLNVSGGTVQSTSGSAIRNNSNGNITISHDALITSGITDNSIGTLYLYDGNLTINGGTVENTGGGIAINKGGTAATVTVNIPAGNSAIVKGGHTAMNLVPTLTNSNVTVAALNADGTGVETYDSSRIGFYKYLKFEPTAPAPSGGNGGSGGGGGSAIPLVTKIESGDSVAGTNVDKLVKEGKSLTVEGKTGEKLVFDTAALKSIDGQTKDSVKVEIKDVSTDHKTEQPGRLVVSLSITAGGKHITSFGDGTATVSLPYELKAGEKAEDVTVWYLAEDGKMTEVPCTYDPATKLATFKVNHFSLYVVGTADTSKWTNPFSDVKESSWFYDAVRYVSANKMMQGTADMSFNPNGKTTRGMIVTILWRMENQPKTTKDITFTDVKDGKYYRDAVAWASEKGITSGYSAEKFGPEDNITREQLAVILYKYAASKGYNMVVSADPSASLSAFSDSGKIHSWSKDSLSWANGKGIITGTGSNLLNPLGAAERCQVAAILQRFVENTAK